VLSKIADNGLGLAEAGEFEILMFKFTMMFNRIPNVGAFTFAQLLANPCWWQFLFYPFYNCLYKLVLLVNIQIM
jgi:hypothetical protein